MSMRYKRFTAVAMIAVLAFGLTTCKKEKTDPPTVKVFDGVITIGITKANVSAEVTDQGGAEVKLRGFIYGLLGGNLDTVFCGSGTGVYSAELNNLHPNTTYVYEAFAQNMGGIGVSGKVTFTTNPLPSYTIHVSASPSNGGVVSGGGSFQEGQPCTIMAMANDGYTFTNWTENDIEVSSNMNYTFMVNGDRNIEARFMQNDYTINVLARPLQGGTVTGGGIFHYGDQTTLAATANIGYEFHGWDDGITTNPRIITVTDSATYTAVFGEIGATYYNVSATVDPIGAGSVTGTGPFPAGDTTILKVVPNPGYTFSQWQDSNTQNPRVVIVNSTLSFTAYFTQNQYNIATDVSPAGTGVVIGGGTYHYGDQTTLTATANNGYIFDRWNDGDTQNPRQITVTSDATYTAYFAQASHTLYTIATSVIPDGAGTVDGGGTYPEGTMTTLTAYAFEGYTFDHWQDGSTKNPRNIMVTGNATYTAHFTQTSSTQYTITISANLMEGGTVTGSGNYEQGQQCVVEATPNHDYTFIYWMENGNVISTLNRFTFTVSCDRSLMAIFKPIAPNNICANAYPICIEGDYEYPVGVNTGNGEVGPNYGCLNSQPNPTWYFFRMDEPGDMDISIYSSRNPDIDFCCWGPFADPISPCPNGLTEDKIVSCSYSSSDIEHCMIPATAQTGEYYIIVITNFSNQSCNVHFSKVGGSGTSDCGFIVEPPEPPSPNYYSISVSSNPMDGGTVSGGGTYQQGQTCTISATANGGYIFINWTENGNFVSANANYHFTVNADHNFVANFIVQPQAPVGAINGLFTINNHGDKVFFSRGNLQYNAVQGSHQCADGTTKQGTWRFAINQWDCVGEDNHNINQYYSGWIDLFGWGTSGWNCGNTYYHPWDSNNSTGSGSLYGPPGQYNLTNDYVNCDWGQYNAISNGGNNAGQWRMLTKSEWNYVLLTRNTLSGLRYVNAQVMGVSGKILLPDNWQSSIYPLNQYGNNIISSSVWTSVFESNGAVFLPYAGFRQGTTIIDVGESGRYWSASYYYSNQAYFTRIDLGQADLYFHRYYGMSVRLVCPAN